MKKFIKKYKGDILVILFILTVMPLFTTTMYLIANNDVVGSCILFGITMLLAFSFLDLLGDDK